MRKLHEAKIARGEVDANDISLLPHLETFASSLSGSKKPSIVTHAEVTKSRVDEDELAGMEDSQDSFWSMNSCSLQ